MSDSITYKDIEIFVAGILLQKKSQSLLKVLSSVKAPGFDGNVKALKEKVARKIQKNNIKTSPQYERMLRRKTTDYVTVHHKPDLTTLPDFKLFLEMLKKNSICRKQASRKQCLLINLQKFNLAIWRSFLLFSL